MDGKQAIGLVLILLGLLIVVAGILGKTGGVFSAMIYGPRALTDAKTSGGLFDWIIPKPKKLNGGTAP